MDNDFTIRTAVFEDIPQIIGLAKLLYRYVQFDEIKTYMQVDPEGITVAEIPACDSSKQIIDEIPKNNLTVTVTGVITQRISPRKVIGTCSGIRHGTEFGYLGLWMVHEKYRNQGLGKILLERTIKRLENLNIVLSVEAGSSLFDYYKERYGFKYVADYIKTYYVFHTGKIHNSIKSNHGIYVLTFLEGKLISELKDIKANGIKNIKVRDEKKSSSISVNSYGISLKTDAEVKSPNINNNATSLEPDIEIKSPNFNNNGDGLTLDALVKSPTLNGNGNKSITEAASIASFAPKLIHNIVDYDRRLHGRDRSLIVRQTLSWESCRCKVAINKCGSVVGYGCLRQLVTSHWVVSPLYADSEDIAEILLRELLQDFDMSQAPTGISVGFPAINERCVFYEKIGFNCVDIKARVAHTKGYIGLNTYKIFSFNSESFCIG